MWSHSGSENISFGITMAVGPKTLQYLRQEICRGINSGGTKTLTTKYKRRRSNKICFVIADQTPEVPIERGVCTVGSGFPHARSTPSNISNLGSLYKISTKAADYNLDEAC